MTNFLLFKEVVNMKLMLTVTQIPKYDNLQNWSVKI